MLDALNVPVESQTLVFSQTSFQASLINGCTTRAPCSSTTRSRSDGSAAAKILEVAAQDPSQGVVFYELAAGCRQRSRRFKRNNECLACHLSWETLGVPGLMVQSVYPLPDENSYANGFTTVHGSPLEQRWGGWWVTGDHGGAKHMGNMPVMPATREVEAGQSDARAAVGRRTLRPEGLPDAVQRRRGAAGARRIRRT